jgi:hypothetical protein
VKLKPILLTTLLSAGAAHAQPLETGGGVAGEPTVDLGLGLLGSTSMQARVLTAWAELGRFSAERHYGLSMNAEDADVVPRADLLPAPDARSAIDPPGASGVWRLKQFKLWQKSLFTQER